MDPIYAQLVREVEDLRKEIRSLYEEKKRAREVEISDLQRRIDRLEVEKQRALDAREERFNLLQQGMPASAVFISLSHFQS